MAKASHQPGSGGRNAFASVFPPLSVKAPKRYQKFEHHARAHGAKIRKVLRDNGCLALGINSIEFEFGRRVSQRSSNTLWRSYYADCPRLELITDPTEEDFIHQREKVARQDLWSLIPSWERQLGDDYLRKTFAGEIEGLVTEYVDWAYCGVYDSGVIPHLHFWVENVLARFIVQFLHAIDLCEYSTDRLKVPEVRVDALNVQRLQEMATNRLASLRIDELFDIVVDLEQNWSGIDDLKNFVGKPNIRATLINDFASVLSHRLLHPGASTIEILQIYISIIRAFRSLDPKGVLLDRVARLIRRYLRDRDDTVRIIVTGLLSDAYDAHGELLPPSVDTLTELALELSKHDANSGDDDGELDWNNMEWVPDPIDAAPDYLKSKNTDVIGSLISLFDTKDVFVRELQATLADRLLRNKPDFDQEFGVLEHLKIRFGDSALQGCEVMLRDVNDSRKVDNVIKQDRSAKSEVAKEQQAEMILHAKILSRLFWPALQDQSYKIPATIVEQQESYEKGFEALKQSRKLTWLNSHGQVEVELDLEDRVFNDEVLPWQAAIIYAFQSDDSLPQNDQPVTKTIEQLAEDLEMSPTLARSACIFWTSKRILVETAKDTYTVIEELPDDDVSMVEDRGQPDAAAAAAEIVAAQAAREAEEAARQEKMAMYSQFIKSMLINQGAMPLPRIAMMLGIVVPGGFPFSNEELKEFLGTMVKEGILEVGHTGAYKAAA